MSDIFREVDEDVRRDRFEQIWKRYGNLIGVVVILLVAAVAGWQIYNYLRIKESERASAKFQTALEASEADQGARAESLLASIIKKGPAGYAMLARLREAAETGKRDAAAGAALYDKLASDGGLGTTLQGLAQLRAAMLLADTLPEADLKKRLEPLIAAGNPWRNIAREWLGLSALKANDFDGAGRYFDEVVIDPEASPGLRQRVEIYLGLVKAGPLPVKPR